MKLPERPEWSETPGPASGRAEHWLDFYQRMIDFEEQILATMINLSHDLDPEDRRMVDETDIQPMRALIEDFRRRRDLWAH